MQRVAFSTDDVPEADRFAYWREAVCEGLIGVSGERDKDQETPFNGKLEGWIGESLARFRYRSDRFRVLRRPRDIARRSWDDCFCLYRESSAGAWFDHDRREFVTRPGDLVIADATVPFATEARSSLQPRDVACCREGCSIRTSRPGGAHIPKFCPAPGAQQGWSRPISTRSPRRSTRSPMCKSALPPMPLADLWRSLGGQAGEHGEAICVARVEEVKRYVALGA